MEMLSTVSLIAGAVLAWPLIYVARRRTPAGALRIYAVGLIVAAVMYVGFAAAGGAPTPWLVMETAGVIGFGTLALMGARRSAVPLASGWAGHALWDVLLHLGSTPGADYTPAAYPWLCLSFDLIVAGATVLQPRVARSEPAA